MFICPKCKRRFELPKCEFCKNTIKKTDGIWQLTDAPDIVTTGEGDKYIGYEHIGGAYSGNRKYLIDEHNTLLAEHISEMAGDGVFLDLACGDGCITVPCARNGTKIIAGDISNTMMIILQKRAAYNNISLENVTLCRINALDVQIEDNSISCVVANSVLHLISNPGRVIDEIYRVLKPGGRFICKDDAPGKNIDIGEDFAEENTKFMQITNGIYASYWAKLNAKGITAKKYSWKFDRDTVCRSLFRSVETKRIQRNKPYYNKLSDSFLPRFSGRGFSDQVDVPDDLHIAVMEEVMQETYNKYGDLVDSIGYHGVESDILIYDYIK